MRRVAAAISIRVRTYLALLSARRASRGALEQARGARVLVLCYGNIYRSPFVCGILASRLGRTAELRSAGFHAVEQRPSPARHVEMCAAYGVSLEGHRSRLVTTADLSWADLIVIMDRRNWAALVRMGASVDRVVWLGALVPGAVEISDPYQMGDAAAAAVVARLHHAAQALANVFEVRRGAKRHTEPRP